VHPEPFTSFQCGKSDLLYPCRAGSASTLNISRSDVPKGAEVTGGAVVVGSGTTGRRGEVPGIVELPGITGLVAGEEMPGLVEAEGA
jgi:hypothetical protein